MNQPEWISLAIALCLGALGYLVPQKLKTQITSPFTRWLQPLVERLFPLFRMEPWLFEPIAADDLPAKQRWFFETHTPGFVTRGFTHLGDFVLRRDPQPSCTRYFLSRDRTIIGGLTCYLQAQTIECMSVLLDGMYLETANIHCSQLPPKEHGLQFFVLRTNDAGEVIEHHAACVAKTAAAANTQPAPLEPEDLQAVSNYGRQLALGSLHQQGTLTELPAFLRERTSQVEAAP